MERDKLVKLVTAAQAGSRNAFSDLFNNFQSVVYSIAMREVKDPETAADVTQETFIEVIQTIEKLQEPAAFVSWLKAITYHQCTRYYRKKETKHEKLLEERDDAPVLFDTLEEENEDFIPDKALENEELCQIIRSFIEQLPDAQRAAIMMKYFDELSVKEIAAVQGVSENTVLSRLYYGRNAIKAEVEEYEEKHGIKLHAIPFFPLFRLLFPEASKGMSVKASMAAAKAISAATGVKVTVTGAGIAASVAAWPIAAKVGAGIAATVVTIATPIVLYNTITPPDAKPADNNISQTTAAENGEHTSASVSGVILDGTTSGHLVPSASDTNATGDVSGTGDSTNISNTQMSAGDTSTSNIGGGVGTDNTGNTQNGTTNDGSSQTTSTAGETNKDNLVDTFSKNNIVSLNQHLSHLSRQYALNQYPASDEELFHFALLQVGANTNDTDYLGPASKSSIDEVLQLFFGKTIEHKDYGLATFKNDSYQIGVNYHSEMYDTTGTFYEHKSHDNTPRLSLVREAYAEGNTYTIRFNIYEWLPGWGVHDSFLLWSPWTFAAPEDSIYSLTAETVGEEKCVGENTTVWLIGDGYAVFEKNASGKYVITEYKENVN